MATCKQPAFTLAMKFTWILYHAGAAAVGIPCTVKVTQPRSLEADAASSNVTISCAFSTEGCRSLSPTVHWFRYLPHAHEDLCMPKCTQSAKFQAASTVPEKQASIRISNVNVEDSAIYFCGVAFANSADPLSKQTGEGTALTIRGSKKHSAGVYIMVAVLLLLFIYIAALFASFKVFSKPKAKEAKRRGHNTGVPIKESGRSISRAIAQELRKKKDKLNGRPRQRLEKETIYQNN
ncbi:immunoglobulin superfamily member 6 [Heteronotia binoei]|uniref:immunoglobulin superfamily member 6 n=1 Tax=Heteronotia binoei TaxID=13085 RepID=UPI00292F81C2|nr:immunoglobulin superfamily member 6 [Heteronotia binoei]